MEFRKKIPCDVSFHPHFPVEVALSCETFGTKNRIIGLTDSNK